MAETITSIPTARSISPDDRGYVTADMLHEYLAAASGNNIIGGTVTWDVDAINIRCGGKSVLTATTAGRVTLGESTTITDLIGSTVNVYGTRRTNVGSTGSPLYLTASYLSAKAPSVFVSGSNIDLNASNNLGLFGTAARLTTDPNPPDSEVPLYVRGRLELSGEKLWLKSHDHVVDTDNGYMTAESKITMYAKGELKHKSTWQKVETSTFDLNAESRVDMKGMQVRLSALDSAEFHGGSSTRVSGGRYVNLSSSYQLHVSSTDKTTFQTKNLNLHGTYVDLYGSGQVFVNSANSPVTITSDSMVNMRAPEITMTATNIAQYQ